MSSLFARSLMAALTVGVLTVSHQATAQTPPDNIDRTPVALFGNEGFGITNLPLGGTIPTASGYSHPNLAQGFKVGEVPYFLESVELGLVLPFSTVRALTTVGSGYSIDVTIFESMDNTNPDAVPAPSDAKVATLTLSPDSTPVANAKNLYKFVYLDADFRNEVRLEAGKTYWLVVSYTPNQTGSPGFLWSFAAPSGTNLVPEQETPVDKTLPPGVTGVGFQYVNTLGQHDFDDVWIDHGPASTSFFNSGLRFTVNGYEAPGTSTDGGGGGIDQTPPTLDCYALSKGYFKNKYPSGWPASVIANGGALIGTQVYTIDQLRTMLNTNSTRGNQIGQLSSQLVAVHLSRLLAIQTAGALYADWWDGWAPESTETQAAFDQAAALINASAGFQTYRGRTCLTGSVTGVSALISTLDAYIIDNHCDSIENGNCHDDDDDDDDDDSHGHCRSKKERDKKRCNKGVRQERRSPRKTHECR